MSPANAALTPRARLRLAPLVIEHGWTYATAAKMFMVAPRTAKNGPTSTGLRVRPACRPTLAATLEPGQDRPGPGRQIVRLRWRHRLDPVHVAGRLGMPASTVHAVLVRCRINRLPDRPGHRQPLRRYGHPYPGSLIHVDVTKFGNIPGGGGHRYVGRQQGDLNKRATPWTPGTGAD